MDLLPASSERPSLSYVDLILLHPMCGGTVQSTVNNGRNCIITLKFIVYDYCSFLMNRIMGDSTLHMELGQHSDLSPRL